MLQEFFRERLDEPVELIITVKPLSSADKIGEATVDILLYRAVSGDEPDEFDLFVVADLDGLQAIEDVPSQADLDRSSGACLDEVDELRFHASIVTKERRLGYVPLCLRDDRLVTAAYNRFRGLRARGILEGRFDGRDAALLLRCGPSTR